MAPRMKVLGRTGDSILEVHIVLVALQNIPSLTFRWELVDPVFVLGITVSEYFGEGDCLVREGSREGGLIRSREWASQVISCGRGTWRVEWRYARAWSSSLRGKAWCRAIRCPSLAGSRGIRTHPTTAACPRPSARLASFMRRSRAAGSAKTASPRIFQVFRGLHILHRTHSIRRAGCRGALGRESLLGFPEFRWSLPTERLLGRWAREGKGTTTRCRGQILGFLQLKVA